MSGDRRRLEEWLHQVIDRSGGRLQTEVLCLAVLATGNGAQERLESWQLADESWPAIPGVDEGATVGTALRSSSERFIMPASDGSCRAAPGFGTSLPRVCAFWLPGSSVSRSSSSFAGQGE